MAGDEQSWVIKREKSKNKGQQVQGGLVGQLPPLLYLCGAKVRMISSHKHIGVHTF